MCCSIIFHLLFPTFSPFSPFPSQCCTQAAQVGHVSARELWRSFGPFHHLTGHGHESLEVKPIHGLSVMKLSDLHRLMIGHGNVTFIDYIWWNWWNAPLPCLSSEGYPIKKKKKKKKKKHVGLNLQGKAPQKVMSRPPRWWVHLIPKYDNWHHPRMEHMGGSWHWATPRWSIFFLGCSDVPWNKKQTIYGIPHWWNPLHIML